MSHLPTDYRGFPSKVDALMAGVPVAEISVKQLLCLHLPPYLHITFSLNRFISKNSIGRSFFNEYFPMSNLHDIVSDSCVVPAKLLH